MSLGLKNLQKIDISVDSSLGNPMPMAGGSTAGWLEGRMSNYKSIVWMVAGHRQVSVNI